MTKVTLEQYQDLVAECEETEAKIIELELRREGIVSDRVQASYKDFPYTRTCAKVEGYKPSKRQQEILRCQIKLLKEQKERVEKQRLEIMEYISGIEDSRIRRMMSLRYIEGYTWQQVGGRMHCDRTTAEKAVNRYLQTH